MAISARAAGTWAVSNATTQQVTIPGTAASGDMMLLLFSQKDATTIPQTVTVDQSWTVIGSYTNGTTTAGNGTGSTQTGIAYKVHTGSETNPTITWGGTSAPGVAVIVVFQRSAGTGWLVAGDGGGGITTTTTSYSQASTSNEGVTAGDMVVAVLASRDDTAWTVPTFTQAGVTYGTATVYPTTPIADATSNDISATAVYRLASSGTSSAAKTVTGTLAAAEWASHYGVRLREDLATTYPGSFTADAQIKNTIGGSFTANAQIKNTVAGFLTANAQIKNTIGGSLTADAYVRNAIESSFSANAYIFAVGLGSLSADAYIKATIGGSFTADAQIGGATNPTWVSPPDTDTVTPYPVLVFTPNTSASDQHYHIQLCTVNTFDNGTLRDIKSNISVTGWEYWNDSTWVALPSTGLPVAYAGNDVRHTVQTALSDGIWYRRVRAG